MLQQVRATGAELPDRLISWQTGWPRRRRFNLKDGPVAERFGTAQAFITDLEAKWRLLHQNVFKRYQAPPVVKASTRAFGFDYHESQVQPLFTREYETLRHRVLGAS